MSYPTPQEEQREEEQLPQADEPADLTVVSPEVPDDFEMNPHADISLDRLRLLQEGHSGVAPPIRRVSKFSLQLLHRYS